MNFASILLVLVVCSVAIANASEYETYKGWKVARVNIEKEEQKKLVSGWDLDVWTGDSQVQMGLNDIRVNQTHLDVLDQSNIKYDMFIEDLESLIASEKESLENRNIDAASWFSAFHTYPEIVSFLQNITSVYPNLVKYIKSIGQTIEGRDIPAVVVTGNSNNKQKIQIIYSGMQHAREWVSVHTVLYVLDQLVSLYGKDSAITNILDNTIIHFVPIVNPDGYLYTWSRERLWRKNRRANSGGSYGVDLNRNWDDHWGGAGTSKTPTSDTYCGTKAFSEPETTALSNYVLANGPFVGGIDFHCYGQLILRPYGWTNKASPDEAALKLVGDTMKARILAVDKMSYSSEGAWELYYTTGSADDWYYSQAKMTLVYTIELRDTGRNGFVLPAAQIIPTGAETFAAMKYYLTYAVEHYHA